MLAGVDLAVARAAVTVGGLVLGAVSFGLGMVASPVLPILLGAQPTVMIINTFSVVQLSLALSRTWRDIDFPATKGLILGGLVAAPIGVFALNIADAGALRVVIGAVIVALGLLNLYAWRRTVHQRHPHQHWAAASRPARRIRNCQLAGGPPQ